MRRNRRRRGPIFPNGDRQGKPFLFIGKTTGKKNLSTPFARLGLHSRVEAVISAYGPRLVQQGDRSRRDVGSPLGDLRH